MSKEVNHMAVYRKLGRPTDQEKHVKKPCNWTLKHGKIETTETRAKETRDYEWSL